MKPPKRPETGPFDQQVSEFTSQVREAAAALRTALESYDLTVRALALKQLMLLEDIRAVAIAQALESTKTEQASAGSPNGHGTHTIRQVAEKLHVTPDAVKKWLIKGKLRKTKAGGRTLILEEDLQAFLRRSS